MDSSQNNSILEVIYYNMEITTEHDFRLEKQGVVVMVSSCNWILIE